RLCLAGAVRRPARAQGNVPDLAQGRSRRAPAGADRLCGGGEELPAEQARDLRRCGSERQEGEARYGPRRGFQGNASGKIARRSEAAKTTGDRRAAQTTQVASVDSSGALTRA